MSEDDANRLREPNEDEVGRQREPAEAEPGKTREPSEDEPDVEAHVRRFGPPLIEDAADPQRRV